MDDLRKMDGMACIMYVFAIYVCVILHDNPISLPGGGTSQYNEHFRLRERSFLGERERLRPPRLER